VAGIRGTVIVAEVFDSTHSAITVLKGVIDVKKIDGGRLIGNPTIVSALQRVAIVDRDPVSAPQSVAPDAAKRLGQEFRLAPPRSTPSAATTAVNQGEVERTARYLASMAPRPPVDRIAAQGAAYDDEDVAGSSEQDGGGSRRDADAKLDNADKAGRADRGRSADRIADTANVKTNARPAAAVGNAGEALKSNDGGGRKNKNRDR
jgi:hypothetical protein